MSIINAIPLLAAAGGDYQISRSVRLRSSASAYFNRTPGSAGSRTTWTWSGWVKRSTSEDLFLFSSNYNAGAGFNGLRFLNNQLNLLAWTGASADYNVTTTQVFRDYSAWYHIVVVYDSTQATASNRVKLYVNGNQITSLSAASYPTQNLAGGINNNVSHTIGSNWTPAGASAFDGYLTEINFIDGQALTSSSFGETDTVTGVWKPKRYIGTYGTNGFYLNFSDNSAATAAAIGKDNSGNANNWTPNNISVTAGVTYDSMIDVPTLYPDGGNGRGNYAVVNPLSKGTSQTNVIDGNLYAIPTSGASNWGTVFSSIAIPTSGKWYMEATAQLYAGTGNSSSFGVVDSASFIPTNTAILYQYTTGEGFDGILANLFSDYVSPIADGVQGTNVTGLTGTSINLMLALDVDNGKVYAGYNGTWLNSGNPAGNTGEVATRTFTSSDVVAGHTSWNGTNDQSQYYNFGQRPFAYTPPTGFKALNTQNLPAPTILKGNQYFDVSLYTGNATARSISGLGFQPDFVWTKGRSSAENHRIYDSVRGATKSLYSNLTNAEATEAQSLTAFNSNGFSLGTGAPNSNAVTYVAWNWKANGSAVSNTSGTITSQVSAGTSQGFSVVTYTGTGANGTVGHGLGVAPKMIIVKDRDSVRNWFVLHNDGTTLRQFEGLNTTDVSETPPAEFNNTAPTSSVFSLAGALGVNGNTIKHVAYCFSEVAGFSRFGSYTGNGSADGVFVFLGFRPKYLLIKQTNSIRDWHVYDSARDSFNTTNDVLLPNSSVAEYTDNANGVDFLSNGFKWRTGDAGFNGSGGTYIFAAFAEHPFKNSLAR